MPRLQRELLLPKIRKGPSHLIRRFTSLPITRSPLPTLFRRSNNAPNASISHTPHAPCYFPPTLSYGHTNPNFLRQPRNVQPPSASTAPTTNSILSAIEMFCCSNEQGVEATRNECAFLRLRRTPRTLATSSTLNCQSACARRTATLTSVRKCSTHCDADDTVQR